MTLEDEIAAMSWLALPRNVRNDRWAARSRYMYCRTYGVRRSLASYPNRSFPFDVGIDVVGDAKERYRWAEESFMAGYLNAKAFWNEVKQWDQAVAMFRLFGHRSERPLDTPEQMAHEARRLSRKGMEDYVDIVSWKRLHQAMIEYRERTEQWEARQRRRRETAHQRAALREGHRTMSAIRLLLRGAARLPQPESEQAKISPTS